MVTIAAAALDAIAAHAKACCPSEACGLLVGRQTAIARAVPCVNHQDRFHEKLPDDFPRDSRTAYYMDYRDIERVDAEARKTGEQIIGIFHSHIDCGAYFSAEDRVVALMGGGEPAFPDFVQIVASIVNGEFEIARAFKWDKDQKDFLEQELEIK